MNKKGIFIPILTLFAIFIFSYAAYFYLISDVEERINIGEQQIELLQLYGEAEKALFYVDESAKYSSYKTLFDLGKNGGFGEVPETCEKIEEYIIWTTNCLPNVEEEFKKEFNENLNTFIKNYKSYTKFYFEDLDPNLYENAIKQNNYDYFLELNEDYFETTGKAKEKIQFFIHNMKYLVDPSFKIKTGYNLKQYNEIKKELDNLKKCLSEKEISEKTVRDDCDFKKGTLDKNLLKFDIESDEEFLVNEELEKIKIQFAVKL